MSKPNGEKRPDEAATTPASKPRGRPETRVIKLDATPEQVARAMFAAVKPPDPSKRVRRASAE